MIIGSTNVSIQSGSHLGDCSAIVLAGGDGTRLRASTTSLTGEVIPKQYCSLGAEACLVQQAVSRARQIATADRVWTIVASDHERWWGKALSHVSREHIIVQPENKGTAFGILLGLLTLEREEAASTVLILPADHCVADEAVFLKALRRLTQWSQRDPESLYLLGAEPEEADPALGYILPWFDARVAPIGVYEFIERPRAIDAKKLINRGALWNTFIVAGSRQALLRTYAERFAAQIEALREAINRPAGGEQRLADEYRHLSAVDFSHEILEQHSDNVQVLRLPVCGWTELGSAAKIEKALSYLGSSSPIRSLFLDLAKSGRD
jgi:mannose-1-phosphate guanylyltransferase